MNDKVVLALVQVGIMAALMGLAILHKVYALLPFEGFWGLFCIIVAALEYQDNK